MSLITLPMVPSMLSIIIGKYNIFHRLDDTMLFVMVKACLHLKIILLLRTFENFVLIYVIFLDRKNDDIGFPVKR